MESNEENMDAIRTRRSDETERQIFIGDSTLAADTEGTTRCSCCDRYRLDRSVNVAN